MSGTLMLVNPRKRRGGSRKRRTAAQRAATARMLAANKRGRRSNPAPRRRRRAVSVARVLRRRRRNPISLGGSGGLMSMIKPAVIGGAGVLAVNAVTKYVPLPASLTEGRMIYVTKFAIAAALGTFGRRLLGPAARQMAEGAMTVLAATAMNDALSSTTGVSLARVGRAGYYSPGWQARPGNALQPGITQQLGNVGQHVPARVGREPGRLGEYRYR